MNLKELLDYHTNCIMCGAELEMKSLDLADIHLTVKEDGLMVETGTKNKNYSVHFKFDGTYEKMKRFNSLYTAPLIVLKECPNCIPDIVIDYKQRSLGATTLDNIKDKRFAYTFDLFGDSAGNYDGHLRWEEIRTNDGKNFHHLKTDWLSRKSSTVEIGSFEQRVNEIWIETLPVINTSNVKSKDAFISKLKMYNLFS